MGKGNDSMQYGKAGTQKDKLRKTGIRNAGRTASGTPKGKPGGNKGKNLLFILRENLTGTLTKNKLRGLAVYFILISALEVFAYLFQSVFSVLASRVWSITGIICFFTIMVYFVQSILLELKEMKYIALVSVIVLAEILIVIIGNPGIAEINPDAAQQAASGLDALKYGDLHYTERAFLGYPDRQYIIAALPALLFGRSIRTLQLGFAFPFILGIFMLYGTFRKWARRLGLNTDLSVLPLYAFLVFPFITEYYANFEQAIYPVCFTMIAVGFFLRLMCEPNAINIICLAWIGCLLGSSYTPALAALGLLLVFLTLSACLWMRKPSAMPFAVPSPVLAARAFLFTEGNIIVFFLASFPGKGQEGLMKLNREGSPLSIILTGIYDSLTDESAVFLGMFGVIVIIYLAAGLTFRLKVRDFLISLWVFAVFAASYLLSGYTAYRPEWIKQRAMLVIPVLITAVTITVFEMLYKNRIKVRQGIILVILVTFAFIGLNNFKQPNQSFTYFNYTQPMKYMWSDLERTVKAAHLEATSEFNLVLYTDDPLMKNPKDYCSFLYPNAWVYTPENGEFPEDIDLNLDTFIYGQNRLPGSLPANTMKEVFSYENVKHNVTGTWHKGVLK